MEDFNFARIDEHKPQSGLQAEWLQFQLPNIATNLTDSRLSVAATVKDNQAPVREKSEASGKDALDKELRNFADSKLPDPSRDMLKFQKAVGKFCDTPDKDVAMDELGDTWSRTNALAEVKAEALFQERKDEAARTPGRKELESGVKQKQDQFFDKVNALPFDESFRITDLMMWQPDETRAQHEERIRKGLSNNKPILDAYNEIGAAEDKVEANKGPREKQLDHLSEQLDSDSKVMRAEVEKAYLRSTIKN